MAMTNAPRRDPSSELQHSLNELRACAAGEQQDVRLDGHLWNVSTAADRVLSEHQGMAEELISAYEQLGTVFEVIHRISSVKNEAHVIELFLDSLRRSFVGRTVSVLRPTAEGGWTCVGDQVELSAGFAMLVERSRTGSAVIVENADAVGRKRRGGEVMVGRVTAGGEYVCSIVLNRRGSAPAFRASDMSLLETLSIFCGDMIRICRMVRELRAMSVQLVRSLVSAVDQKDEYTCGHSLRVAYYATILGKALDLGAADLQMLQWSALLHDVGKIGIRDDVLKKPGKLTDEEMDHIKEHPVRSHKLVSEIPPLAAALDGVLYHHEHYDGNGYPTGLSGEDIPRQARIIQIADVFDALTSSRSYRPAFTWEKALKIMNDEAGKTVDAALLSVFDDLIRPTLEGNPGAWEQLVRKAGCFASIGDGEILDANGE